MIRNLTCRILITAVLITILSHYSVAEDANGKNGSGDQRNSIHPSMTIAEFYAMKCKDLVPFPERKIKHHINDNRLRKYYKFKPLMSVVMREIDIKSYFEIVFNNDKLEEINQYDLDGNFIKETYEYILRSVAPISNKRVNSDAPKAARYARVSQQFLESKGGSIR